MTLCSDWQRHRVEVAHRPNVSSYMYTMYIDQWDRSLRQRKCTYQVHMKYLPRGALPLRRVVTPAWPWQMAPSRTRSKVQNTRELFPVVGMSPLHSNMKIDGKNTKPFARGYFKDRWARHNRNDIRRGASYSQVAGVLIDWIMYHCYAYATVAIVSPSSLEGAPSTHPPETQ